MSEMRFRFIDLFSGIGGFRKALDGLGGHCVLSCEWNKTAREVYLDNYPSPHGHVFPYDIRSLNSCDIPEYDLLVGGFPCQPFSSLGRGGRTSLGKANGVECEKQGDLFFEIERILLETKPRGFLLENVVGLSHAPNAAAFKEMLDRLRNCGFDVSWRVISAAYFVPQMRKRIFIVGLREPVSDLLASAEHEAKSKSAAPLLRDILHPEDGSEPPEEGMTDQFGKVLDYWRMTEGIWQYLLKNRNPDNPRTDSSKNKFYFHVCERDQISRTLPSRYENGGGGGSLVSMGKGQRPRLFTAREAARLMGFDKGTESLFKIPPQKSKAFRLLGNAVVPQVVEAIVKQMLLRMESNK